MDLKTTYNKIAKDWHREHQSDDWWVKGADKFCSLLPPGASVLDVGCGAGTKTKYLISKGLRVLGIDFAKKMIDLARVEVPEGEFQVLDIKDLASLKRSFDGVFAQAVLLHFPKKQIPEIFQSLAAKVKPKGYLYVTVKQKKEDGPEEAVKIENDHGYAYERFFSYFTLPEVEGYFKQVSFDIVYSGQKQSGRAIWIQVIGRS